jgi:hypothetical protein
MNPIKLHQMADGIEQTMRDLYTHAPDGRLLSAANPSHVFRPADPGDSLSYAQGRTLVASLRRMATGQPIPDGWVGWFVRAVANRHT